MRFFETLEFAGRYPASRFFCAKIDADAVVKHQTAVWRKKGVDGYMGGPYKPPLPDGPSGALKGLRNCGSSCLTL